MIGNGLWRRRFGADPQVIGKTLTISGSPYTIIGVLPAEFRGQLGNAEMWLPIMMWPGFQFPSNAKNSWALILARLKPDVTVRVAQAEMDVLTRKMIEAFPPMDIGLPGFGKEVIGLKALKDAYTNPELKWERPLPSLRQEIRASSRRSFPRARRPMTSSMPASDRFRQPEISPPAPG